MRYKLTTAVLLVALFLGFIGFSIWPSTSGDQRETVPEDSVEDIARDEAQETPSASKAGSKASSTTELPVSQVPAKEDSGATKDALPLTRSDRSDILLELTKDFDYWDGSPISPEGAYAKSDPAEISKEWNSVTFGDEGGLIMGRSGCYISRVDWPGEELESASYVVVAENSRDLDSSVIRIFKDSNGDGKITSDESIYENIFTGRILTSLSANFSVAYAGFLTASGEWSVEAIVDTDEDDLPDSSIAALDPSSALLANSNFTLKMVSDFRVNTETGEVRLYEMGQYADMRRRPGSSINLIDANRDGVFESAETGRVIGSVSAPSISMKPVVAPSVGDTRVWAQAIRGYGTASFDGEEFELLNVVDAIMETTSANAQGYLKFDLTEALGAGEQLKIRHKTPGKTSASHSVLASATKTADIACVGEGTITGSPIKVWGERLPVNGVYRLVYENNEGKDVTLTFTIVSTGSGYVELGFDPVALKPELGKLVHPMFFIYENDGETFVDALIPVLIKLP